MLLKKQTVWLLTMLSLVVVLSVYYVTSPDGGSNLAFLDEKETAEDTSNIEDTQGQVDQVDQVDQVGEDSVISSISSDDLFTALRLDLTDSRNILKEQYQDLITSSEVSAEEKSIAIDKMEELEEIAAKETMLEMLIKSTGYEDALVRAEDNQVRVTVKAKEQSAHAANEIIRLVKSEIGSDVNVAVTFQISDK